MPPMSADRTVLEPGLADAPAILIRPLPGGQLLQDYLAGRDLSAFYTGHHSDAAAYQRKAVEVEARLDPHARAAAGAAIEPLGDAAGRLERILAGDGFFVTTGQQPALFGGPLYTIYKILGAIRLADSLERRLSRPVLALFWIGSDDHDWDEANHVSVLDAQQYVRRITVKGAADAPPVPLSMRTWGPGVEEAVTELAASLPDTVHAVEVMAHVRAAYVPDSTVAASFAATLRYLLHDRRVAIVDSAHPALRRAAGPVLRADAARVLAGSDPVARQTSRLQEAGYDEQVAVAEGASNLMLIDEQGRDRIIRTARGWATRRERSGIGEGALFEMIEAYPDRFSPNVLLRPVVESAVFPTLAYVAGPSELSYFAQIGCLFEAHGILPPVVVPRPSVTLVDEKACRTLERLGIDADALRRPFREVVADAVSDAMPADVAGALDSLRTALETTYDELAAAAGRIDPTLRGPLRSSRNASLLDAAAAEKKIRAHLRTSNHVRIEQLRRLASQIHPDGKPQERVLGPLTCVAAYGRGIIAAIEAELDMEPAGTASWRGPACQ
ncbi:MAG TPA: bacillithiol biosynthesis cysteine-adding enzyme BshC [Longimicrobiales bacterium]|nr:bacillithiol biosynthesis cysteine-adding enzyme BshC [Longimicrobiales bacterium]